MRQSSSACRIKGTPSAHLEEEDEEEDDDDIIGGGIGSKASIPGLPLDSWDSQGGLRMNVLSLLAADPETCSGSGEPNSIGGET